MAGIKRSTEDYKCTRPSEIIKSERRVAKVKEVLANEFLNPFDPTLDQKYLFNIGSGIPVDQGSADGILATKEWGEDLYNTFLQNRILSTKEKIHNPIKRQEKALFENSSKKVTVKKNGKEKIIEANREIIGTLLALSAKHDKLINFGTTLQYFLCPVPLSLAHPDDTRRKTAKSALTKVVKSYKTKTKEDKSPPKQNAAFLVDFVALIRTVSSVSVTYAELAKTLVSHLPKGYQRVDISADTYRENSLENNERDSREVSSKVIIHSASSRIPRNFTEYLRNGDNKTRLTELIKDELIKNSQEMLGLLSSEMIFLSLDGVCLKITRDMVTEETQLSSNQEEADTKLLLHANHVLHENQNQYVVVWLPSGDVNINMVCLAMFPMRAERM